ncbi:AhpC/TSA family protein [Planctomycetes bacterium CA13]|uniref:AhpC/TSA family protein n=1 Tax=Novipirellula herctigrandis TaxID=2527986 RepID=A0A5C5YN17_9BACT|nr:AhpC/TSA family protein [Planctomycetes bacterium CA13]
MVNRFQCNTFLAASAWLGLLGTCVGCSRLPDDGVVFTEVTKSQPITIEDFSTLTFTDKSGDEVKLADLMTQKYLVLVITRGWNNGVCFYCASQTSRWARRFDELAPYDAQLVVVFPVESEQDATHLDDLAKSIKKEPISNEAVPYPMLLDINLTGVDQLGIRSQLAKPATYIVDREGRVRFAYVGESIADRPTVDSVLEQLGQLGQ